MRNQPLKADLQNYLIAQARNMVQNYLRALKLKRQYKTKVQQTVAVYFDDMAAERVFSIRSMLAMAHAYGVQEPVLCGLRSGAQMYRQNETANACSNPKGMPNEV